MDWDAVEALWERGFAELAVDAKEHPILLGDSPTLRESDREKMAELLFETYNIPACVQRLSSCSPYLSLALPLALACSQLPRYSFSFNLVFRSLVPSFRIAIAPQKKSKSDFFVHGLPPPLVHCLGPAGTLCRHS
jgi:hypothetical protein